MCKVEKNNTSLPPPKKKIKIKRTNVGQSHMNLSLLARTSSFMYIMYANASKSTPSYTHVSSYVA
jgi:hypothetical protein